METTLFEVRLTDGRIFRVFCANKNQRNRFKGKIGRIKDLVKETKTIANGIHNASQWDKIVEAIATETTATATENNKLIAEFIGMAQGRPNETRWQNDWFDDEGIINGQRNEHLHFDTSFDWLMPVVKKCLIGEAELCLDRPNHLINNIYDGLYDQDIDRTYLAVVEFIKWHNSQNQGS